MTGAACVAGNAYPSGAPNFTSGFYTPVFDGTYMYYGIYGMALSVRPSVNFFLSGL